MAWQCMKCLHHIPNGVSHSCINDELRDLQKQYAEAVKLIEEMAGALDNTIYDAERLEQGEYAVEQVNAMLNKYRKWKEGMK